jgi:serine phosphatase RsbU (regulator of sigma subunit)
MFGRQRLASVLAESRELSVHQTAARINEAVKDFRSGTAQTDDVTLVLVEVSGDQIEGSDKQE